MFLKLLMIAGFVSVIIFLARIYPNLKKPLWQRKIVSADYLRIRKHGDLADGVIIEAIGKEPSVWQLYMDFFNRYSSPWDMQKLFNIMSSGLKHTDHPGVAASLAWCLIEEGEFEKAGELLERDDVKDHMTEFNLPYLAKLYFKQEKFAECEKAFIEFYKKIYSDAVSADGKTDTDEKILLEDLSADELIILASARRKLGKAWKNTAKIIPVKSMHEEDNWNAFYEKLLEQKSKLRVTTGIYGPPEKLLFLRKKELDEKIDTVREYLGIR
jgi:tetratricopeptide (TPR) repeat protein